MRKPRCVSLQEIGGLSGRDLNLAELVFWALER